MNFYKVKYLKNSQPHGRAYIFKSELDLQAGDKVDLPDGKHGVVDSDPVDSEWVDTYVIESLKEIVKKTEDVEPDE